METTTLQAEVRAGRGKGPARRLRAQGKLPAVVYGPGIEPTPLTVDPEALEGHLRAAYGRNTLFNLAFEGKEVVAMVKDIVVEPVGRALLHVDFVTIDPSKEVIVDVPFTTHGRPAGVVAGGLLNIARRTVRLRCKPADIPAIIDVDVEHLNMFETFSVKDLPLADGVVAIQDPELTLAIVMEDKAAKRLAAKEAKEAAKAAAKG